MTDTPTPKNVYTTRVSGLWNLRHEIHDEEGRVGLLEMRRNALGLITAATYTPEKGAVLTISRDPGLRRSQYSMWSSGREWIASSERDGFLPRPMQIHTGGKPFHLVPLRGFVKGWGLHAPRTGEAARMTASWLGRASRIEVYKRLDFPLLLLAYFLGYRSYCEAIWPGPRLHAGSR
ncbi:MAG: hypothetical protein ACI87A_002364 [Planctomycetota bacterium]|jgi:hypothetical protein